MNKKVSLKDAFVRNMESSSGQLNSYTATQPTSHTASQLSGQAEQPAIQPTVPLYTQETAFYPKPPLIKKKATFNLDASLHQRLKVAAAIHSREMVDIVEDALQAYLPALDGKLDRKAG